MDNRFFITVCSDRFLDEILFETQGNLPIREVLKDVLKILTWPIDINGKEVTYIVRTEEKELNLSDSLISAGLENFGRIWISPVEKEKAVVQKVAAPEKSHMGSIPEPYWAVLPVDQPALIHPKGFVILLDKPPVLIGRRGGGENVQVDLTEFEKEKLISSRRHAEIILQEGEYCLRPLKTRNGTFIGRDEIQPGEVRRLKNNDIIQFGAGGVRLIFRTPVLNKV